jgi:hypothetical protein
MTKPAPPPAPSPFLYTASDYQENEIRITVTYDNSTRALTGATVFRDSACVYKHLYLGLGTDGTPDATTHKLTVPAGTTTITANQLSAVGLNTAEDIYALQITAGP